jgi:hypothetical protein
VRKQSFVGFICDTVVRVGGPDEIAVFAIRPDRTDIGGYGGASPGW